LRLVFSSFIPVPAAARAMVSEFAVLYYGFCSWRARPHVSAGAQVFTLHRKTMAGDLFFCVAVLSLIEILPVHLLVSHWSATAAWILTALSIYGAIWLMAMARAFTLRPMLVSTDGIVVRYGLLFNLRIPAGKIRAVRTQAPTNAIIVPRNTTPSVYLEFTEPLEAEIVLGVRKRVTSIGLSPDDAAAFEAALQIFKSARVLK